MVSGGGSIKKRLIDLVNLIEWQDIAVFLGVLLIGYFVESTAGWPGLVGYAGTVLVIVGLGSARQSTGR